MPGRSIPFYKGKGKKKTGFDLQCTISDIRFSIENCTLTIVNLILINDLRTKNNRLLEAGIYSFFFR